MLDDIEKAHKEFINAVNTSGQEVCRRQNALQLKIQSLWQDHAVAETDEERAEIQAAASAAIEEHSQSCDAAEVVGQAYDEYKSKIAKAMAALDISAAQPAQLWSIGHSLAMTAEIGEQARLAALAVAAADD